MKAILVAAVSTIISPLEPNTVFFFFPYLPLLLSLIGGQNGWPKSPNCDPGAPKDECQDYSGCKYMGDFAAFMTDSNPDGHKSIDYVKTHNLVSFFDATDPKGNNFDTKWARKTIQITKTYNSKTYTFNATIADTCLDSDCSGCCTKNAGTTGFLVDVEYYTALNNFGTTNACSGTFNWKVF